MAEPKQKLRWRRLADKRGPLRILVLDLGSSSTRVVELARHKNASRGVQWTRAFLLPAINPDMTFGDGLGLPQLLKERGVQADYVATLVGTGAGMFRLIQFPGRPGEHDAMLQQVRQTLGVEEDHEVRFRVLADSFVEKDGKGEFTVMAASMPATVVRNMTAWLRECGLRPVSLQVAGVALANLVEGATAEAGPGRSVGFLELSTSTSILMILHGEELALARQFKFGSGLILERLKTLLELDHETACKFYESGSFDFSADVKPLMTPWLHQLSISLDYFERRTGQSVGNICLYGRGAASKVVGQMVAEYVRRPVSVWNPMSVLPPSLEMPESSESLCPESFAAALAEGFRLMRGGEMACNSTT